MTTREQIDFDEESLEVRPRWPLLSAPRERLEEAYRRASRMAEAGDYIPRTERPPELWVLRLAEIVGESPGPISEWLGVMREADLG